MTGRGGDGARRRHVLVVGAGPGGLAAADAALAAGAKVTLVDAADAPGGQYHRAPHPALRPARGVPEQPGAAAHARRVRRVLAHPRCAWWPGSAVWALERTAAGEPQGPPLVHLVCGAADGADRDRHVLAPDALVLAPGAHDRMLPFPGWDLPGVCTAGAAQALVKGERVAVGDRVVVAGTGPFLLPVAATLLAAGSRVLEVCEAAGAGALAAGWAGHRPWELAAAAGKARELGRYGAALARRRVPLRTGRAVVAARGAGRVEEVVTAALRPDWSVLPGTERVLLADAVCVSHGFSPQLELPLAAGCALGPDPGPGGGEFVTVDADQRTSCPGVYAAGEITGIAGAPAARAEGALAGWCAAGGDPAAAAVTALRRARAQARRFAARLASAHPIGAAWPGWLRDDTVICRCEGTDYAALCGRAGGTDRTTGTGEADSPAARATADPRVARLTTRAGLGPCQARVCGPTVAELTARTSGMSEAPGLPPASPHRRPLAHPVRLGELARAPQDHTERGGSGHEHPEPNHTQHDRDQQEHDRHDHDQHARDQQEHDRTGPTRETPASDSDRKGIS